MSRRRPRVAWLLAGSLVAGFLAFGGVALSQSDAGGWKPQATAFPGGWRVQTVVSHARLVSDAQVAVSESGAAVLAWIQGRPPAVCSQGPCRQPGGPFRGFQVMASQGTATKGFDRPIKLSANGDGHIFAAQLSSGVSYVAWDPYKGKGWRIAAIDHGRPSGPTVLPADAQLQGLFTGREREAAAVWATPGNPWNLHYAFLDPRGHLGRQGTLAPLAGHEFGYPSIAINDRGDLAAVWMAGPKEFTKTALMAVCDARGRCAHPRALPLPQAVTSVSVALSDRGAVFALEGSHSGLWAAIGHVDQAKVRAVRVASGGGWPIAVSDGLAGAAVTFLPADGKVAQTIFDPTTGRFSKPVTRSALADVGYPEQVAASLSGRSVFTWLTSCCLRAVSGSGTRTGQDTDVPGSKVANQQGTNAQVQDGPGDGYIGIDGRGNEVLTWKGFGGSYTRGLYAAIHRIR